MDTSNDSDFSITGLLSTSDSSSISGKMQDIVESDYVHESFAGQLKQRRYNNKKKVRCKFCDTDVISTNFMRHLQRHHAAEKEVQNILCMPPQSKARRDGLALLRNYTNFDLFLTGTVRTYRKKTIFSEDVNYHPCAYCRGLFRKTYLKRHAKSCIAQKSTNVGTKSSKTNYLSASQTVVACEIDPTGTISKLNVKDKVFNIMKGDEIAFVVKKDLLIANVGESYLKKHKKENLVYACSNRMREIARLLIQYRRIVNKPDVPFKELLHPKNFTTILLATRQIVGYNPEKKCFKAPSLAMHLGTSLKLSCDELSHLILEEKSGFKSKSSTELQENLKNVKNFKKLIDARWNTEISSLAHKDMMEKKWTKPLLLPLVNDIKIFREECMKIAADCVKTLAENNHDDQTKTYSKLVQCVLSLLIIFNRRRIGDVQFLKISDYNQKSNSNFPDFQGALSKAEKMLANKYKRVVNSGKGSREVVILIPEIIQNYINILLKHRAEYISPNNEYVFSMPGSNVSWGKGDVAIRSLAKDMNLKNPKLITSNKLRKHIATVTQILNLTPDETKQFSAFMGHTEKTHQEFYELPVDIYQTAKVSKLLLLMERGSLPLEYKGKSLSEIDFDSNLECAVESDNEDTVPTKNVTHHSVETASHTNSMQSRAEDVINDQHQTDDDDAKEKVDANRSLMSHNTLSEVSSDSETEIAPVKKKTKRTAWSTREINALENAFKTQLLKGIYPTSVQIEAFLQKNRINRCIVVVKAKLQHLMKLRKKKTISFPT